VGEADTELVIDYEVGSVAWSSGRMWFGPRIRLVDDEASASGVVVIHSRGYSVGSTPNRIYMPASYHVFRTIEADENGHHRLEHVSSFPVRIREAGIRHVGLEVYWRPYPDPKRTIGNGAAPHPRPDPLSDGSTNLN
jgi:hypothetical protein